MMFKRIILFSGIIIFFFGLCVSTPVQAAQKKANQEESDQQISEFSLSGYEDKGKKSWDLAGQTADIFTENIKLNEVVGNLYGKDEDIKLTAETGDFNKTSGQVHLEKNVVITTSSGAKLTTDSLDWDRKAQLVTTDDTVNIVKENMVTAARGIKGEPNLKKIALTKEVRVDINPIGEGLSDIAGENDKTVITCDGPLVVDYDKNIATFNNNVKVERPDTVIYSDKMDIYFIAGQKESSQGPQDSAGLNKTPGLMGNKIDKIVCRENVRVVRGENVSYSDEAIYSAQDKKLILTGRPKLIIYSTEGLKDASFGN